MKSQAIDNLTSCYDIYGDGSARLNLNKAMRNRQFIAQIKRLSSINGNFNTADSRVAELSRVFEQEGKGHE